MKKKFSYFFLFVAIYFVYTINVSAALDSFSGGADGDIGSLGSGEWYPDFVGLKISIVDEKNDLEDVEIFINKKPSNSEILSKNTRISTIMRPKTHYKGTVTKEDIKWSDTEEWKNKVYVNTNLPSKWTKNDSKINMYKKLEEDDYKLLLEMLNKKVSNNKVFETLENQYAEDHYILVEPMTYIGGYFGTAFELLNEFAGNVRTCDKYFCYWYTGAVFGGDLKRTGLLYDTLYTTTVVPIGNDLKIRNVTNWIKTYIQSSKEANWIKRNRCLKSKSCGRGLGVFKYSVVKKTTTCKSELKALKNEYKQNIPKKVLNALYKKYKNKGKEYNQLKNYNKPSCTNKIDPPDEPKEEVIVNCDSELDNLQKANNATPKELVKLYNTYSSNNGLLNFENPTCTPINCEDSYTNSCMTAQHGEDDNDFSCAKPMDSPDGTKKMYCKSIFKLSHSRNIDELVKSGMLIYAFDEDNEEEEGPIMTGNLIQKCYSETDISGMSFKPYNELVSNVTLAQKLTYVSNEGTIVKEPLPNSGGYIYKKSSTAEYYYPDVFAMIGTGKIVSSLDDPQCIVENESRTETYNVCRFIGKGIATQFNYNTNSDTNSTTTLDFRYNYKKIGTDTSIVYGVSNEENYCKVEINPELVSCENDKNCKLNLEFRTIESEYEKAFKGRSGDAAKRNTGINWSSNLAKKVLNYRNDSKNKKNSIPLYTITLDSATIKNIRNYNKEKNNEYDDFNFNCNSGRCYSQFLLSDIFTSNNFIKSNRDNINWLKNYSVRTGDIDLDGKIDSADSSKLRNCIKDSNKCDDIEESVADLNSDGILDCYDAVYINLYSAKLISTLPVKPEELTSEIQKQVEEHYQICINQ